ncbi:PfkB family carbohydrate kinase [Gordonia sp. HY002]|uniref:PfkB family carbohydrate kinase n=1 Tax=Gordonia zhenghanii TaxID=2911516 RepID=UPI001EF02126|nr:PfkB family carbohydrate kinase [Gordonia zhenghanii]MCF8568835.1 PfkB family carbohydrate kinase [Gordonia zhenghanii]MCF8602295.1 PfkB family carbohydrate kinase [Gordonia zhenghanii]
MIIVGGEALVDLVPVTAEDGRPALRPALGGGPFNAAIAAARLGARTGFLSRISTDGFGGELVDRLRDEGVDLDLVQRGDELTTLAVADTSDPGAVRYGFYVNGTADRLVADPGPLSDEVSAVVLGTVSMVLEPGASVYDAVLEREAAAGRVTVMDPNIRAALIDDPAAYRTKFRKRLAHTTILKSSIDDIVWLADLPDTSSFDDVLPTVRSWIDAGVDVALVTLGADGIAAVTADAVVRVPGVKAEVVDTIGAGDTVLGALLARLDAEHDLTVDGVRSMSDDAWTDVLTYAARAAAVTVARPGADPPRSTEL